MRTRKQDYELLIDEDHLPIVGDDVWLGLNVYTVNDLSLLILWFNKTIRFAGDNVSREIENNKVRSFHAAVWSRINQIHPKFLLRFADITYPELLKKSA